MAILSPGWLLIFDYIFNKVETNLVILPLHHENNKIAENPTADKSGDVFKKSPIPIVSLQTCPFTNSAIFRLKLRSSSTVGQSVWKVETESILSGNKMSDSEDEELDKETVGRRVSFTQARRLGCIIGSDPHTDM